MVVSWRSGIRGVLGTLRALALVVRVFAVLCGLVVLWHLWEFFVERDPSTVLPGRGGDTRIGDSVVTQFIRGALYFVLGIGLLGGGLLIPSRIVLSWFRQGEKVESTRDEPSS